MTQTAQPAHLSHLSQLDHLRPPPGWRTDCAVLSTYSAHTSVVAAALLALGGQNDEKASGTRIGLARVLRELRGKVHFVLQSGRLTSIQKPAPIVALLDRFILQVPWNEGRKGDVPGKSWHAKFALVRHVPTLESEQGERWVFMLGSRNLTQDMSWDIGLVLSAGDELARGHKTTAQAVGGIAQIAADLGELFPGPLTEWKAFSRSLAKAQWRVPNGLAVSGIHLMLPDSPGRGMPKPPAQVAHVLAVSPFLDGTAVASVAGWGGDSAQRQLLSTRMALEQLAPQAGSKLDQYELLALPAPQFEIMLGDDEEQVASDQMGLHAKMLLAMHGKGGTLWLGSPNLTSRGWTRNAECHAQIDILSLQGEGAKQLLDGMEAFRLLAQPVSLQSLMGVPTELTTEQRLAEARNQVASSLIGAAQRSGQGSSLRVECKESPHPRDAEILLSCGALVGDLHVWPRDATLLEIPAAADPATASDCLRVRVTFDGSNVEWLQVVPWNPPLEDGRDDAVLSAYLGPRQMLAWIHDVLHGYSNGDEGGAWDGPHVTPKPGAAGAATVLGLPSIDQALRMWLKDKKQLDEVDRILQLWSRRKVPTAGPDKVDQSVELHLQRFSRSWQALRKGLRKDIA